MKIKIINYILENKQLNTYFGKVDLYHRDDFKQHIYLILLEMLNDETKYNKICELYNQNRLGMYINGLITNQLKSNNSSFTTLHKPKNISFDEEVYIDFADEPYSEIEPEPIVKKILVILDNVYPSDAILYKLYRGIDPLTNTLKEPLTYSEIQKLIGINYQAVRNSIIRTDNIIKERIKI